jgi:hypothetical protein
VRSEANGNYSANVSAGRYLVVVEKGGYPAQKAHPALVEAGVATQVDLYVDSGIR